MVEINGFEPLTPCLQGRCSSQLSYTPVVFRSARSCQKSFRFVRSTFKPFSLFFRKINAPHFSEHPSYFSN